MAQAIRVSEEARKSKSTLLRLLRLHLRLLCLGQVGQHLKIGKPFMFQSF